MSGNVLTIQSNKVVVSTSLLPTSPLLDMKYGTIRLLLLQVLVPYGNITYVVGNTYPLVYLQYYEACREDTDDNYLVARNSSTLHLWCFDRLDSFHIN